MVAPRCQAAAATTVHLLLISSARHLNAAASLAVAAKAPRPGSCPGPTTWKPAFGASAPAGAAGCPTSSRRQSGRMAPAAAESAVLEIERVPCLSDNYSWLLHEPQQGTTAVVDPAEVAPVLAALRARGWKLTHIINTHHHWDHVGGNEELQRQCGCIVVGPAADHARIPGIQVQLKDGDRYQLGATEMVCYDTPGHTRGHVTYHFPAAKALFPGDTLFSLGCGRLFEGTPAQMWSSLSKLALLPTDTLVYCAHEYTASNAKFAVHVDEGNEDLQCMKADIEAKRAQGEPTVPSLLGDELKCNPFLRPGSPAIRTKLGVPAGASDAEAFGAIRSAKDTFR